MKKLKIILNVLFIILDIAAIVMIISDWAKEED